MVNDLSTQSGTNAILPLPPNPDLLRAAILGVPGLTLLSFTPRETSRSTGASATIQFNSVDSLNQAAGSFSPSGMTFLTAAGLSTFTQTLYSGNPNGVSAETLQLVKQLFSEYRLTFSLKAPRPVKEVSIGEISADKSTASYTTTVPDIIQSKTPVVWEVSW
jgi:hypothetical protein